MAYATYSDVEALNSLRTFTASSEPSKEDVLRYLENVALELDGMVRALGYSLPIATGATSAIGLLRKWNAEGAWAFAERSSPNSPHADAAMKAWEATKKMLQAGKVELDAGRDSAVALPRAPDVGATPMFTLDMEL